MNLYEFEGKQILSKHGISVPNSILISRHNQNTKPTLPFSGPYILKSQVLSTNRKQKGGILKLDTDADITSAIQTLFSTEIDGSKPEHILIEQQLSVSNEYFISFTFSTSTRSITMLFSEHGGSGIEQRQPSQFKLSTLNPVFPDIPISKTFLKQLFDIFVSEDMRVLEINPITKHGNNWVALDAKVVLDDEANFRHKSRNLTPRTVLGRKPTQREIQAKAVNDLDHRGSAGATYLDLGGDIGVMASGGGASIIIMDTLLAHNIKPANYTEYSGNPPREKVKKLADIVLSHNIKGLLVVGGNANFTDIYETLMGIMDSVLEKHPTPQYPIVIRRGGPRWQEAFSEIEKLKSRHNLNIHLFGPTTPMTYAVTHLIDLLKRN